MAFGNADAVKYHIMRAMRLPSRFKPFSGLVCIDAQLLCADMRTKVSSEWLEQQRKRQSYLFYYKYCLYGKILMLSSNCAPFMVQNSIHRAVPQV